MASDFTDFHQQAWLGLILLQNMCVLCQICLIFEL